MVFKLTCVAIVACTALLVHSAPIDRMKLRFRISARGLPDKDTIGTVDPYVEIWTSEDGQKEETKLGRSATITDNENPDWGEIFEFEFDRSKHQRWQFKVYDHDNGREDDKAGKVYVDVADYVDKNQRYNANLSKKGFLIIAAVDPVTPQTGGVLITPAPSIAVYPVAQPGAPVVVYSQVNPDVLKLKFKLSARDLPDKDKLGLTDPFVELYYTENGSTKEIKFGRSSTINDNKNPDWGEVFEFDYDRRKNQKWLFRVYDHDQGREDDSAGKVWVDVNDYVTKGQRMTTNLSKKGTLTIATTDTPATPQVASPVIVAPQPQLVTIVAPQHPHLVPIVVPLSPVVPVTHLFPLKFKLSAKGLDDKDIIGTSDPYVKAFYKQDDTPSEISIGNSDKLSDTENPNWSKVFDFTYDATKKPKWHFLLLDDDDNRKDDELGDVWVDVGEYLQKNQNLDIKLKKGTLTIKSA